MLSPVIDGTRAQQGPWLSPCLYICLTLPGQGPRRASYLSLYLPFRLCAWAILGSHEVRATEKSQRRVLRGNPPDLVARLYRTAVPHGRAVEYSRLGPGRQTDINKIQSRLMVLSHGQEVPRP